MLQAVSRTFKFSRCDNFVPSFGKKKEEEEETAEKSRNRIWFDQANRIFFGQQSSFGPKCLLPFDWPHKLCLDPTFQDDFALGYAKNFAIVPIGAFENRGNSLECIRPVVASDVTVLPCTVVDNTFGSSPVLVTGNNKCYENTENSKEKL